MSFQNKIKVLTDKIKEKEDAANNISIEAFALRGERELLVAQLIQSEQILVDTNWELKLDSSKLYLEYRDPPGGSMDIILDLHNNDYHSWFDLETGIRLEFSDNYISLSFEEPKQLMPFVKKNKMKIWGAGILDRLAKLKRETSSLEEVCHTFSITK